MTEIEALRAEVERLTGLLSRIAGPACNYGSRVYRLTDDFTALRPYLSDEEVARAEERPSSTDDRLAVENEQLREQIRDMGDLITQLTAESDAADAVLATLADLDDTERALEHVNKGSVRLEGQRDAALDQIATVRALHRQTPERRNMRRYCVECATVYPCRTIAALSQSGPTKGASE